MRLAAKRDANEAELVKWLRYRGWVVHHCSSAHLPDLLCMRAGEVRLVEVKMPGGKLTRGQTELFEEV
jgi:Holliday junction resolvase